MNWRTPLARTVYWIGGQIARIKYPSKTYTIKWDEWTEYDYDNPPWRTEYAGRTWMSHPWGTHLGFHTAHKIDPKHYDHWALIHDASCRVRTCDWCGGDVCTDEDGAVHAFGGGRRFR